MNSIDALKEEDLNCDYISDFQIFPDYTFHVKFISYEQPINITVPCQRLDTFSKLKEKLYQIHPELRFKNLDFIHCGSLINEYLTNAENNINIGDLIFIAEKKYKFV